MGLIYFEGGPLNGTAYETRTLLGTESLKLPVLEYVWTSDKKTSEKTGSVAQVWRHQSLVPGVTPAQNGVAAVHTQPGGGLTAEQVAQQVAASVATAEATISDASQPMVTLDQVAGTTTPTSSAPVPSGGQTAQTSDLPSGASLFERRKAMKLSVGNVVEACNHQLAHSKIGAIEKESGKRIKPEEIRLYDATLTALEAQRGGAGAHP